MCRQSSIDRFLKLEVLMEEKGDIQVSLPAPCGRKGGHTGFFTGSMGSEPIKCYVPLCSSKRGRGTGTDEDSRRLRGVRACFPVFATSPVVILDHSQTVADQGEKKARHCESRSSRKTSSTASSPRPHCRLSPGPSTKTRMGCQVVELTLSITNPLPKEADICLSQVPEATYEFPSAIRVRNRFRANW